jgi:hypothetical protein
MDLRDFTCQVGILDALCPGTMLTFSTVRARERGRESG